MSQFTTSTGQAFSRRPSNSDPVSSPGSSTETSPEKSPLMSQEGVPIADASVRTVRFHLDGKVHHLGPDDFVTPARATHSRQELRTEAVSQPAIGPLQPETPQEDAAPCCTAIEWAAVIAQRDPLLAGSVTLQCLLPFVGLAGAWGCGTDAALLGQAYGGMTPALFSGAACLRDADRSWRHVRLAERDGASTPSTQAPEPPESERMLETEPIREHSPSRGPVDGWLDDGFTIRPADTKGSAVADLPKPVWHPTFTGGLSLAQLASGTMSLMQEVVGWTPWMTLPVAGLAGGLCLCCWGACQSRDKYLSASTQ